MSKISELSDGGVIQGGDTLIAVRSGGNVKVTYGGSTTANIDGGTIDGTVIGGSSAAAGTFTSITGTSANINGTVTADGLTSDGHISATGVAGGSRYIALLSETSTYTGSLTLQAGGGSSGFGGGLIMYGHSHASNAGDVVAGISAGSGGSFRVNSYGVDGGVDYLKVDSNGDLSLYEDTGTTAKFFWDASAEALGIGTASPNGALSISKASGDAQLNLIRTGTSTANAWIWANGDKLRFGDDSGGAPNNTRMCIETATGNVGIGTTSPMSALTAVSGSATDEIVVRVGNDYSAADAAGDAAGLMFQLYRSYTPGLNDAAFVKAVKEQAWDATEDRDSALVFGTRDGSVEPAERMRIDSSGNLLVGRDNNTNLSSGANTTVGVGINGAAGWAHIARNGTGAKLIVQGINGGSGTAADFVSGTASVGTITYTASATAYNTSSDYRLKENVVFMDNASDRVLALNPVRFNFIADPEKTVDGFLAHEAQEVVPEAVTGSKDAMRTEEYEVSPAVLDEDGNVITEAVMGTREVPDYQGIDQSKLVPLLTKALQEALTEIADLKARVSALETN